MSLYKANALVNDTQGGTNAGTYAVHIRSVLYSTGSAANVTLDNISADSGVADADIIAAVKAQWGLGALDLVRVL